MADTTLAALASASALTGPEILYGEQDGEPVKLTAEQLADLAQAGMSGGGDAVFPTYVAGRWYYPLPHLILANGSTVAANQIQFIPLLVHKTITITELGARVATAATSQNSQFAIYARDAVTGKPTGPALASTGNVSVNGTGVVSGALTAPVELEPGAYFLAQNSSGSPAFAAMAATSTAYASLVGGSALTIIFQTATSAQFVPTLAQTFGTWPDVTAASISEVGATSGHAIICFRVQS